MVQEYKLVFSFQSRLSRITLNKRYLDSKYSQLYYERGREVGILVEIITGDFKTLIALDKDTKNVPKT